MASRWSATATGSALTIGVGPLAQGLTLGASLAVQGACLTAARIDGADVQFDVIAETLARTTLGGLRAGSCPSFAIHFGTACFGFAPWKNRIC